MGTKQRIQVYDTTLRDGNQATAIGLSCTDKLSIASRLHDLGVHYIEGGWPTPSNVVDAEFFAKTRRSPFRDKLAVFGSTRRKHTTCGRDELVQTMVKAGTRVATVFGKSWDLHVESVLGTSLPENLAMIGDTVRYLKRYFDEVLFDAEHFFDGCRENSAYALETLHAAQQAGADCIVLCDTNGGMLPEEFRALYAAAAEAVSAPLGIHTHNDSGCAAANTFQAVQLGAVHVQGTINGLGERCGNANLCTIIPGLQLKLGYAVLAPQRLARLTEASVFVSEVANISHDIRQPYVGEAAFSHKAGTHADGVRKVRRSFEHVPPESVGNARRFVVSDQAGTSTILAKLTNIAPGVSKRDPRVRAVLKRILALEAEGFQFEAADASFELVVREMLGQFREPFDVNGFRTIGEHLESGDIRAEATIKVAHGGSAEHTASDGDGPVNALDNALRKALVRFFPSLASVKLEDYKVRVLDASDGTEAKVRVLIESSDGRQRWGTIGVSTNIIEASWQALVDSLKYKLMKESLAQPRRRAKRKRPAPKRRQSKRGM
jgi:2-isopropylmalate synthase